MDAMVSQITGGSIVYSTVCSGENQRKHQGPASLALTGEFPAQNDSNAENISIWWRHDVFAKRYQAITRTDVHLS